MIEHDVWLDHAQVGQRIVPPTSFHGFPRFMMQTYHDAMVIVWSKGILDVFLTFILNPNSQEIAAEFEPNQTTSDHINLVALIF